MDKYNLNVLKDLKQCEIVYRENLPKVGEILSFILTDIYGNTKAGITYNQTDISVILGACEKLDIPIINKTGKNDDIIAHESNAISAISF